MTKIGLTGGIGSGKSTATAILRNLKIPVIDADLIVKNLTKNNQQIRRQIQIAFPEVATSEGKLNQKMLREIIFSDQERRRNLEAILHPAVRTEIQKKSKTISGPSCVIVIPLLIEADMSDLVDKIVVIDCNRKKQIERVTKRDHCTVQQVMDIINTQAGREERLANADFVIDNNGDLKDLEKQLLTAKNQWENDLDTA